MDHISAAEASQLRRSATAERGYWSSVDTWERPYPSPHPTTITAKKKAAEARSRSTSSPLLNKLPVELRLIVFKLVLHVEGLAMKVSPRLQGRHTDIYAQE